MKRVYLYLLTLLVVFTPMIQSCDDGYDLGNFTVRMATVRVVGGSTYYLEIDNGKKLWPAATNVSWYKPIEGQRVLADFTLLSDKYENYDHMIRVNYLWDVLTKRVEDLTAESEDVFGNDPVDIEDMWIGGDYLNVRFRFRIPHEKRHRVSLIRNTTVENPDDGYIHLEYRYDNQDDESDYMRRSYVSFHLGDLAPLSPNLGDVKGLKVKINSDSNGEKELVFDYNNTSESAVPALTNDVVNEGIE